MNISFLSSKSWKILGLMFILQFPSFRALYKYLAEGLIWIIPIYFLALFFIYILLLRLIKFPSVINILSKRSLSIFLIIFITLINFFVYPIADKRKAYGKGSDQDDALIVTSQMLLTGNSPYKAKTYFSNNPISPGPGWIILCLPFSANNLHFLLSPFYLFIIGLLLRKIDGTYCPANLFFLLSCTSLVFWETTLVGSDLFPIGAAFLLCLYFSKAYLPKYSLNFLLSAVLFGAVSTSRIIFLYSIFLIFLLFFKFYKTKALVYSGISFITAVSLHYFFYLWNEKTYPPLHLLGKGSMLIPGFYKILTLALALVVLFVSFKKVKNNFCSLVFYFWLCLLIPLASVSIGDLINFRRYDFALWEGANYFIVLLPIYLTYFCLTLTGNEEKHTVR